MVSQLMKENEMIMKFDKPICEGNHGGLRLRLLTSAQLGSAQLFYPLALALVGYGITYVLFETQIVLDFLTIL